jgi:hypothetical protein
MDMFFVDEYTRIENSFYSPHWVPADLFHGHGEQYEVKVPFPLSQYLKGWLNMTLVDSYRISSSVDICTPSQ